MATEMEFITFKEFVSSLDDSSETPSADAKAIVCDGETDPVAVPANANALENSATESDMTEGNVVEVWTPSGKKKLDLSNVAKAVDVAALGIKTDNVAHSIAPDFDPTRTSENPYKIKDVVTYTDGKTYIFKAPHYGAWTGTDVDVVNLEGAFSVIFDTNPEYKFLVVDHDGYLLFGVDEDGNFVYGKSSQIDNTIINKFTSLIAQWYDSNFIYNSNPQYKSIVVDADGYMLYGVDADGNFVYGKSKQIESAIESKVSSVAQPNVLSSETFTSSSTPELISFAGECCTDGVWLSVMCGSYYSTSYTYDVTVVGGTRDGYKYSGYSANRRPRKINVGLGCKGLKISLSASGVNVAVDVWRRYDDISKVLKISRNSSSVEAHLVCDGVNDEEQFQRAAAILAYGGGTVEIGTGDYYFDDLPQRFTGEYGGVIFTKIASVSNRIVFKGAQKTGSSTGSAIHVRDSAFANLPEGAEAWIFGAHKIANAGVLKVYDLRIEVESNAHKFVAINGQFMGGLVVNNCRISAGANAWSDVAPAEGSVGIRGVMGDCNGTEYELKDVFCVALYEGFQLGGEHLVMTECGARFCYYAYSFGNYDYGSWYEDNPVTCSHPLTLINCCDEGSRALPLFAKCGVHSATGAKALQAVNMINFNLEVHTALLEGAEEVTPGSFCGIIDFVAYGASNSSKNTTPSASRGNRVDTKFWKDGSGENFTTINDTHKLVGTTTEREGYWAQLGQRFYDTTLNKLVYCIDSENQTWVDCNGNLV